MTKVNMLKTRSQSKKKGLILNNLSKQNLLDHSSNSNGSFMTSQMKKASKHLLAKHQSKKPYSFEMPKIDYENIIRENQQIKDLEAKLEEMVVFKETQQEAMAKMQ